VSRIAFIFHCLNSPLLRVNGMGRPSGALAVAAGALAVAAAGYAVTSILAWVQQRGATAATAKEARSGAIAGLKKLKLTILYASTTGSARRYAAELQKALFALNVAGFHFDVAAEKLSDFNAERLEDERLLLVLLPTWTGGTPPESARAFLHYLRDVSTDFRVSKNHFAALRFAIFGLGCSDYDTHWCAAAIEVQAALEALQGTPLLPLEKGDDSRDQDGQFVAWTQRVLPALCELYAEALGVDGGEEAPPAPGCGTCGPSAALTLKRGGAGEGGCGTEGCACGGEAAGSGDLASVRGGDAASTATGWLPRKEYRRQKRAVAEEREKAAARAARVEAGAEAEEYVEEDAINDALIREEAGRRAAAAEYVESDEEEEEKGDGGGGFATKAAKAGAGAAARAARSGSGEGGVLDLEDLGTVMARASAERQEEEASFSVGAEAREMVTPAQRKALLKEGYKIIGSHSAVKLCRWTKAQLRGRGGCYKHTFYGIQSYQCMEATPSLACANKCTFCWRHHKNPVGRSWRWKVDDPAMIVAAAVEKHVAMIREFKGAPGVLPERLAEAETVAHCALSLVGEPIMYPHVNALVRGLHERRISSFLVTNAQFPEAITALGPVTQLYVSVDAATKDVLRAIDRPLFVDFWERFLASLAALKDKGQRTVYRLTLVKEQNMGKGGEEGAAADVAAYAELLGVGQPDFIEVKGVTWCGVSEGSNLSMANVPWHTEVRAFCEALCAAAGGAYELAAEHAHSCCVLLAKPKFKIDGRWHTHIDYARFHALVAAYYASDGAASFTSMDYVAPTPEWAEYGAAEGGFDPIETRWRRNKGGEGLAEIPYQASESGCG